MVKGISRQVIMVHSPDPKLFDQAIFILKDSAVKEGITDELLMKEAKAAIAGRPECRRHLLTGLLWALGGGALVGMIWAAVWFL